MKYKNKINQIKHLLGVDVKLMDAVLDNGVKVMAESWEVGFPVFAVAEDGTQIALPQGEYVLEDGTKFTVDADGIITVYGEASSEEAPEGEAKPTEEDMSNKDASAKKIVESIVKETQFSEEKKEEKKEEVKPFEFSDEQKVLLSEMIEQGIEKYFAKLKADFDADQEKKAPKKEELSEAELTEVKPVKHSVEKKADQKPLNLHSQSRKTTTKDRVFKKLFS